MKSILTVLTLLFIFSGCSDEGRKYNVKISAITKMASGPYCTYVIVSPTNSCIPADYFLEVCDKYKVGDIINIEIARGSQTKTCQ
ncbi:MAG TPA: hypothetical protein PLR06_08430 [Cyclobacteriaceae bacterium]|nr:hypothetical protein [Cyclobacteriaceae bacterium]